MTTHSPEPTDSPAQLTDHLFHRREAILSQWRLRCEADPDVPNIGQLSRDEFNDRIPLLLNVLEQRLMNVDGEIDIRKSASNHGLHRWHKGYSLRATLAEITHLQAVVGDEVGQYLRLYAHTPAEVVQQAYRAITSVMNELMQGSIEQYDELQRAEAVERAANLQRALDELNELSRQRSDYLRTAAHDLRGNLGVISGAASLLELSSPESEQDQMVRMVQRNAASARELLTELMDMARLEAGQETLNLSTFDVASMLQELVVTVQPVATERGLMLQGDGPPTLLVQGDASKIKRIAQNLLTHALRTTRSGWVSVMWLPESLSRWVLSVQDSNPEQPSGAAAWLSEALRPTPETAAVFYDADDMPPTPNLGPPPTDAGSDAAGDGLGLFAVKKLCELLNANFDLEVRTRHDGSQAGSLFRVRFPALYEAN